MREKLAIYLGSIHAFQMIQEACEYGLDAKKAAVWGIEVMEKEIISLLGEELGRQILKVALK